MPGRVGPNDGPSRDSCAPRAPPLAPDPVDFGPGSEEADLTGPQTDRTVLSLKWRPTQLQLFKTNFPEFSFDNPIVCVTKKVIIIVFFQRLRFPFCLFARFNKKNIPVRASEVLIVFRVGSCSF